MPAGLDPAAIDFLRSQRVELNAMTSRQLVDFVEGKLKQHGIKKWSRPRDLGEDLPDVRRQRPSEKSVRGNEGGRATKQAPIQVPAHLEAKVKAALEEKPDVSWHRAVRLIVDPDAEADDDEDNAGDDAAEEDDLDE